MNWVRRLVNVLQCYQNVLVYFVFLLFCCKCKQVYKINQVCSAFLYSFCFFSFFFVACSLHFVLSSFSFFFALSFCMAVNEFSTLLTKVKMVLNSVWRYYSSILSLCCVDKLRSLQPVRSVRLVAARFVDTFLKKLFLGQFLVFN